MLSLVRCLERLPPAALQVPPCPAWPLPVRHSTRSVPPPQTARFRHLRAASFRRSAKRAGPRAARCSRRVSRRAAHQQCPAARRPMRCDRLQERVARWTCRRYRTMPAGCSWRGPGPPRSLLARRRRGPVPIPSHSSMTRRPGSMRTRRTRKPAGWRGLPTVRGRWARRTTARARSPMPAWQRHRSRAGSRHWRDEGTRRRRRHSTPRAVRRRRMPRRPHRRPVHGQRALPA